MVDERSYLEHVPLEREKMRSVTGVGRLGTRSDGWNRRRRRAILAWM